MNKVYNGFSKSSGIYKITNKENGLVYFGQAAQLATRAMQHECTLNKNKHANSHLQAAWNKYGSDVFEFEVIAVYPDKTERDAAEQTLIDEHYGPGCYNMMKTVLQQRTTWSHTPEETSAKRSAAMKGRLPWNTGKTLSPEHIAKMTHIHKSRKRRPWTLEERAALSAAHEGQIPWSKGIPMSEETKEKMSAALKGRIAWNKGKTLSPEHIAKIAAAMTDNKNSQKKI